MAQSWTDIDLQEQWALSADELALLPGMTNTGRLAFAVQLKFMEIHGRFPERHDEIDPAVLDWLATQVGSGNVTDGFVAFELDGRQGRRQRRTISGILGIRPTTGGDRQRLSDWLANDVLPFDPQARHGRDLALEWCKAQHLEPPALEHLDRVIRSTVHGLGFGEQWNSEPT